MNLLTACSIGGLLQNLTVTELVKKSVHPFHGTRALIIVLVRARHSSITRARWIRFTLSHPI